MLDSAQGRRGGHRLQVVRLHGASARGGCAHQVDGHFPNVVKAAGESFSPSLIAAYAYDLAKTFNGYYHDHSILREEDEQKRRMRLMLAAEVARIIRRAMALLGIEVPQRM